MLLKFPFHRIHPQGGQTSDLLTTCWIHHGNGNNREDREGAKHTKADTVHTEQCLYKGKGICLRNESHRGR